MKQLKIIFGIVLILFGTITIIQMFSEESGETLYGAIVGYCIILLVSGFLINSAIKKTVNSKNGFFIDNNLTQQIKNLKILKDKNIISDLEYQEKLDLLNKNQIYESKEYKSLKNLLDNGIFTKQEFDIKLSELSKSTKESYESSTTENEIKRTTQKTEKNNLNQQKSKPSEPLGWKGIIIIIILLFLVYMSFGTNLDWF